MSEQSPWGTPPPSGPGGTPGPTPQPPYQAGGAGGWSGGPPSYGVPLNQGPYGQGPGGPHGPNGPKKKRTGVVLGVLAAVLLVVGAFVVTFVVVNNGEGDPSDEASRSESTSEPTDSDEPTDTDEPTDSDEPTEDPTTETSEPTEDPTTTRTPVPTGEIVGNGYSFDLPAPGWNDASADAKDLADTVDTAIVLGGSIDLSQSSIIVEAVNAGMATSLEQLEDLWKRNLSSTDNATPVDIAEIQIAGERAIGVRIDDRVNNAGDPIRQIAYLVLHEGEQYSIGLSFPASGDDVSQVDFKTMLASWSWTN